LPDFEIDELVKIEAAVHCCKLLGSGIEE